MSIHSSNTHIIMLTNKVFPPHTCGGWVLLYHGGVVCPPGRLAFCPLVSPMLSVHLPGLVHSLLHSACCTAKDPASGQGLAPFSEHARGMWLRSHSSGWQRATVPLLLTSRKEHDLPGACSSGPCSELVALKAQDSCWGASSRLCLPLPLFFRAEL